MTLHVTSWVSGGITASARADQTVGLPVIWDTSVLMWRHFNVYRFTWAYKIVYHYTVAAGLTHSIKQSINQSINHRITQKTALGNQTEAKLPHGQLLIVKFVTRYKGELAWGKFFMSPANSGDRRLILSHVFQSFIIMM